MAQQFTIVITLLLFLHPGTQSQTCRRDNGAVEEQGRLCPAPCTKFQTCRSENKKCLCDGECGLVCVTIDLECPQPGTAPNGFVELKGNQSFGSEANYFCHEDYFLKGNSRRLCRGDGSWSGDLPACLPRPFCPISEIPRTKGMLLQRNVNLKYFEDESVYFICGRNYKLTQAERLGKITCRNTSWINEDNNYCQPKNCRMIDPPDNGYWSTSTLKEVQDGDKMLAACVAGFKLVGSEELVCDKGSWVYTHGRPHCHDTQFEDETSDFAPDESSSPDVKDNVEMATEQHALDAVTEAPIDNDVDYWQDEEDIIDEDRNETSDELINNIHAEGLRCSVRPYPNVETFRGNFAIRDDVAWLPDGSKLSFRCVSVTQFVFVGSKSRRCLHGEWTGLVPRCKELIPGNKYSPPLITYESESSVRVSTDGTLEVAVGSSLSLHCHWPPAKGNPSWSYLHQENIREEKWNNNRDTLTLVIWRMTEDHSGNYRCLSPLGRAQTLNIRVDPFFNLNPTALENQWLTEMELSLFSFCDFRPPPNIIAWHNGIELQHLTHLPENSAVTLRCRQPGLYSFRGAKEIVCHNGHWIPDDNGHCERLSRNSEISPPPIEISGTQSERVITEDGIVVTKQRTTLYLDCLWVYPEPGEGWYYPSWFRTSAGGDLYLPAEIIRHETGNEQHSYFSYRITLTNEINKDSVLYTCMTPAGLQNHIRIKTSDYCLLSSLEIPMELEVNKSSIKSIYLSGEKVHFLGCHKGTLFGLNFIQCLSHGKWSSSKMRCHF